ncbi:MAG: ROK family protein, partial [Oscillospiraceae bacterium]
YEQYASCTALVARSYEANPSWGSGRVIFKEFYSGNPQAEKIINHWIDEIVLGLISLVHIFNPSAIVLGGGIMNEQYNIDRIHERLRNRVMPSYRDVKVKHAKLGNNAALYGMLATVKQKI